MREMRLRSVNKNVGKKRVAAPKKMRALRMIQGRLAHTRVATPSIKNSQFCPHVFLLRARQHSSAPAPPRKLLLRSCAHPRARLLLLLQACYSRSNGLGYFKRRCGCGRASRSTGGRRHPASAAYGSRPRAPRRGKLLQRLRPGASIHDTGRRGARRRGAKRETCGHSLPHSSIFHMLLLLLPAALLRI
jgi:hypothetical protein